MELEEELGKFKCKSCGKERSYTHINTFKHPIMMDDSTKIIGYHHINYCYDNLICYIKASRKEICKNEP
jgi:hypothetical protein